MAHFCFVPQPQRPKYRESLFNISHNLSFFTLSKISWSHGFNIDEDDEDDNQDDDDHHVCMHDDDDDVLPPGGATGEDLAGLDHQVHLFCLI